MNINLSINWNKVKHISQTLGKIALLFLVLAFLTLGTLLMFSAYRQQTASPSLYQTNEYQIVFLANNLFYFCKLQDLNTEYVQCNDPYYLVRKTETAEDGTKQDKIFVRKPSEEEVYQPDGPIYLMKQNIVYIAKVGSDSEVLNFINSQ